MQTGQNENFDRHEGGPRAWLGGRVRNFFFYREIGLGLVRVRGLGGVDWGKLSMPSGSVRVEILEGEKMVRGFLR